MRVSCATRSPRTGGRGRPATALHRLDQGQPGRVSVVRPRRPGPLPVLPFPSQAPRRPLASRSGPPKRHARRLLRSRLPWSQLCSNLWSRSVPRPRSARRSRSDRQRPARRLPSARCLGNARCLGSARCLGNARRRPRSARLPSSSARLRDRRTVAQLPPRPARGRPNLDRARRVSVTTPSVWVARRPHVLRRRGPAGLRVRPVPAVCRPGRAAAVGRHRVAPARPAVVGRGPTPA